MKNKNIGRNNLLVTDVSFVTASTEDQNRPDKELPKMTKETLLDRLPQESQAYPPDLLAFPLRPTSQISPAGGVDLPQASSKLESPKSPTYGIAPINSALYSRLQNSYQEIPLNTKGYVTLPRRPRLNYTDNSQKPQVFSTLNGVIPYYDNFNMKLFGHNNYYSLNKSEMDLGPVNSRYLDVSDDIEPAPSPAPGTPHASIPRNSLSSPNIHNQLLMLQAMSSRTSIDQRPLRVTLENESLLKNSVRDLRVHANTKVRSNPVPKPRKRISADIPIKETFLNTIENATQV